MTDLWFEIEEASLNAWPAQRDIRVGTWLVRIDRGYTKRANCIYGWGEPDLDLEARIADCGSLSRSANLPVIIREADWKLVDGLAEFASSRGVAPFDETIVMTRRLVQPQGWSAAPAPEISLDAWLARYLQFEGGTKGSQETHREILERITRPVLLAVHSHEESPVSIGLAVADGPLVGLFDIATDPEMRGQGFATLLVEGMLAWAIENGCDTVYLQVMARNGPARHLYTKLGFTEAFRYHYYCLDEVV